VDIAEVVRVPGSSSIEAYLLCATTVRSKTKQILRPALNKGRQPTRFPSQSTLCTLATGLMPIATKQRPRFIQQQPPKVSQFLLMVLIQFQTDKWCWWTKRRLAADGPSASRLLVLRSGEGTRGVCFPRTKPGSANRAEKTTCDTPRVRRAAEQAGARGLHGKSMTANCWVWPGRVRGHFFSVLWARWAGRSKVWRPPHHSTCTSRGEGLRPDYVGRTNARSSQNAAHPTNPIEFIQGFRWGTKKPVSLIFPPEFGR